MKIKLPLLVTLMFSYLSICLAQKTITERSIIEINEFSATAKGGIAIFNNTIRSANKNQVNSYTVSEQSIPIIADPFLAFSIIWEADKWNKETDHIQYRFYENSNKKSEWKEANIDIHADQKKNRRISQLIFENKNQRFFDIRFVFTPGSNAVLSKATLHFFNPGNTKERNKETNNVAQRTVITCPCPQPNFEGRLDWCPSGDCPEDTTPAVTTVTHLIVHHSAGTNASSDWAGVVRSVWDYHVNVNGWDDIGYNWLVDPNGVLYEGRGDNVRGAHFCGTNTATMGVCVLGDFTNISPTIDAKSKLKDLLAWKSCDIDANPLGSSFHTASSLTLNHISGHKDGCSTECPGDMFYPELGGIRTEVNAYIQNNCAVSNLAPPTNLEGTVTSSTTIQLDWQDNASNETNFVIERSSNNNSDYQEVGTTLTNITNYEDNNLTPNTAYFYKVKAVNAQEESAYSNEIGIATVVTNITDLSNELGIQIFPNPVQDVLNIKLKAISKEELNYQLKDYTGKLIKKGKFDFSTSVKMNQLPKGLYLLTITKGVKKEAFKIERF